MTIPTLETERLVLRPFAETDLDRFAAMYADPEVMRHMGDGRPFGRAASWRTMAMMIGHWELRGYGQWALVEKATGRLIGRAGLWNPEGWPGLEVGWLLDRARWGQGFATEAARASLDHAFHVLDANHVISVIAPANIRSIRVAERIGETFESTIALDTPAVAVPIDVAIYGIDRREWKTRQVRPGPHRPPGPDAPTNRIGGCPGHHRHRHPGWRGAGTHGVRRRAARRTAGGATRRYPHLPPTAPECCPT